VGDLPGGGGAARALGGAGGGVAAAGAAPAAGPGAGAALMIAGAVLSAVVVAAVVAPGATWTALPAALAASSVLGHAGSPSCGAMVKRASAAREAPRAQSAARIGFFPAGVRVESAMGAVPVPTSTWRFPRSEERRVGNEGGQRR